LSKEDRELLEKNPETFFGKIRSITQREYEQARKKDIPIFAFVDSQVLAEYSTYKANKENSKITYAFVDNVKIYELIDDIYAQRRNNYLKEFVRLEDITTWLRDQWSGLFSDFLKQKVSVARFRNLEEQLKDMRQVADALKTYNEAILKSVNPKGSRAILSAQEKRFEDIKSKKFYQEGMISYIRDRFKIRTTSQKLFKAFNRSESLVDFLTQMGLTTEQSKTFLRADAEPAEREYKRLVERYKRDYPLDEDSEPKHLEF
jgi:hypothetical protein